MSEDALKASARKVHEALAANGLTPEIRQFPESTRSAADAAAAIGCQVAEIAKSLVFRAETSDAPVLVIASGSNRVDIAKLSNLIGEPIGKADAAFVRASTGFAIGGVPPIGHDQPVRTVIDRDLAQFDEIWAAGGTPNAVFAIGPQALVDLTGGQWADIKA